MDEISLSGKTELRITTCSALCRKTEWLWVCSRGYGVCFELRTRLCRALSIQRNESEHNSAHCDFDTMSDMKLTGSVVSVAHVAPRTATHVTSSLTHSLMTVDLPV